MINLPKESIDLLSKCIENHNKDLLYIIKSKEMIDVDYNLGNALRECVSDELIEHGFSNDKPNNYGTKLEKLIDEIGRLYF